MAGIVEQAHAGAVGESPGIMLEIKAGAGAHGEVALLAPEAPDDLLG
jgi:hypothetical protein